MVYIELSFLFSHVPSFGFLSLFLILSLSSILFLLLFFLRHKLWYCTCDICRCYLTSDWSLEFNNLCDWYTHLLRKSPTQTIHLHVLGNTITANPKNVEHVLKSQFHNYPKGKTFSMILVDLLGRGIFNIDGDLWLFQRKMASLELGRVSIRSFAFENVNSKIKYGLLPLLSSVAVKGTGPTDGLLDLQDVFRRFSFDYICKLSFGLDLNCLDLSFPISHFSDSFDLATKLSAERATVASPVLWKIKRFFNMGSERKLKVATENINSLAKEVIKEKRKLGFLQNQDLLSRFMAVTDDDAYLRDIVVSFILDGRDRVASALSSFFWLLATHPEVEFNLRVESNALMEPNQEFATFEQVRDMIYLHAAIYESMRLYPPIPFDSKFARKNDVLPDGTIVSKGTRVTYHPYAMGRMETIWGKDCKEFKPERWLKNGSFNPESQFKYPIFQAGIRACLGKEMAIMVTKTVVVSVLRGFELKLGASFGVGGELRFDPGLTATVRSGLPVIVKERRNVELHP